MQPTLCSRCKKNVAVVFISRTNEKNETVNEGLCLKCAAQLGLPQVEDMMKRMGISPDDLEGLNNEMMQAFGGAEEMSDLPEGDGEDDEESGKTATFPFLNRLFGSGSPAEKPEEGGAAGGKSRDTRERKADKKKKYLDNYCINLSQRARDGKLDAVIGRAEEIERVVQILNRRQKNNPCLIGEPGVGKTAIAEGLAQRIVTGEVPFKLRDKEVYLLDLTALVAGTQFRGQFESRMKGLIEEIRKLGNVILVIDEVHNIVGAGDAEGSMNAANILKPALSRGEIQVIGATTFNEYRKHIEKDTALERRFQPVTVNEPSMEDTLKILKGIAHYYESFHGVKIPEGILRQAVKLSERYITDRFLPDKAIDLIDEACSDMNLHDKNINRRMELKRDLENVTFERETLMSAEPEEGKELTEEQLDARYARIAELRSQEMRIQGELEELEKLGTPELTMDNIARVIELWTKIPASKIREEEYKRLSELDQRLKQHIVGQDEAVEAVTAAIRRNRVGISPKHKPVSFIFVGSTGVGKTELVRVLANELDALNQTRKEIEQGMQAEALTLCQQLERSADTLPGGLAMYHPQWHQGVVGILASRIKERFHRPVIAFAPTGDGTLKGSGRSIQGLHMRDALERLDTLYPGLILKFGGHAMAAGLSLEEARFEEFQQRFGELVTEWLDPALLQGEVVSDGPLAAAEMSMEVAQMLRDAGPWGQMFPEPLFDGRFRLLQQRLVGERHLKVMVEPVDGGPLLDGIAFNVDTSIWPDNGVREVQLAYKLDINEFRGNRSLQLIIDHLWPN